MFIFLIIFFIIFIISFCYLFYLFKGIEYDLNFLLDISYDLVRNSYKEKK